MSTLPPLGPFFLGFGYAHDVDYYYPWESPDPKGQLDHLYRDLAASGATWFRPTIFWNRVEPEIGGDVPDRVPTDADVEAYTREAHWGEVDLLIHGAAKAGVRLSIVLGCAYTIDLPWTRVGERRVRFLPDLVGRGRYLHRLALHARAVVRRYSKEVVLWQLENELNAAGETEIFRWRHGRAWWNRAFQDEVIRVLHDAVRAEAPEALTTHNFVTDFKVIPRVYSWKEDVRRWARYLDVIGLDTYPNYVFGRPVLGGVVGWRVRAALGLGLGKPVVVMETGYPVRPAYRLFSERGQAEYLTAAFRSAREAGAAGVFFYALTSHEEGHDDPRWEGRGVLPLQGVERYWGVVRPDGTVRPAFEAFRKAV